MRISEMLKAIASWLESPNNEAILLSEYNDDCLKVVSESCILASSALKKAAQEVDLIEPKEDSNLTPEAIDELAEIAYAFDASGDENLRKQASVIDELLLVETAEISRTVSKTLADHSRAGGPATLVVFCQWGRGSFCSLATWMDAGRWTPTGVDQFSLAVSAQFWHSGSRACGTTFSAEKSVRHTAHPGHHLWL